MLVLSRKIGEAIVIDGKTTIKIGKVSGGHVKLVIDSPRDCLVDREEIAQKREGSKNE